MMNILSEVCEKMLPTYFQIFIFFYHPTKFVKSPSALDAVRARSAKKTNKHESHNYQ